MHFLNIQHLLNRNTTCWHAQKCKQKRTSFLRKKKCFYQFFLNLLLRLTWNVLVKIFPENFFFFKIIFTLLWTLVWYETLCIHGSYINESVNFRVNNSRRKWCSQQETLIPFPNYRMMKTFTDRAIWRYVLIIYTYWYLLKNI